MPKQNGLKVAKLSYLLLILNLFGFQSMLSQNLELKIEGISVEQTRIIDSIGYKKQFNDLHYKHEEYVIDVKSQIEKNRLEIKKLFSDGNTDEASIIPLVQKNGDLKTELSISKVKMWLAISNILTEEQKDIWKDHFEGMRERFRDRVGRSNNRSKERRHRNPGLD